MWQPVRRVKTGNGPSVPNLRDLSGKRSSRKLLIEISPLNLPACSLMRPPAMPEGNRGSLGLVTAGQLKNRTQARLLHPTKAEDRKHRERRSSVRGSPHSRHHQRLAYLKKRRYRFDNDKRLLEIVGDPTTDLFVQASETLSLRPIRDKTVLGSWAIDDAHRLRKPFVQFAEVWLGDYFRDAKISPPGGRGVWERCVDLSNARITLKLKEGYLDPLGGRVVLLVPSLRPERRTSHREL